MNSRRQGVNLIRGKSIFVLATCVTAATIIFPIASRAQQVVRGEFSVSQAVRWGNSVLPMGDYVFFVEPNRWPFVVRVEQEGGGFSGMFIPEDSLRPGRQGKTGIVLGRTGNDTYVMSLRLQGLWGELDFSVPVAEMEEEPGEPIQGHETGISSLQPSEFLTIINPNHEKVSPEEVEKVYLRACEAVEKESNRPTPIRPRLILRLGANGNVLRYPMQEIQLKKWDEYRFADAVVELALHDKVTPEERVRLSNTAIRQAGAIINICKLKACVN
jgi:hypothetical protein